MGTIVGLGLIVASVVGAALSQLLSDELKAWAPSLINIFVKRAVSRLPERLRSRYDEEWRGHIDEVPGQISKIFIAAGLIYASYKISASFRSARGTLPERLYSFFAVRLMWLAERVVPNLPRWVVQRMLFHPTEENLAWVLRYFCFSQRSIVIVGYTIGHINSVVAEKLGIETPMPEAVEE